MQDPVLDAALGIVRDHDVDTGYLRSADGALDRTGGDQLMQAALGPLCQGVIAAQRGLDVGIDEEDPLARIGEKSGQVGGQRGFADTALGGTDGQDYQGLLLGSIAGDRPGSRVRFAHVRLQQGLSVGHNIHRPGLSSDSERDQAGGFV